MSNIATRQSQYKSGVFSTDLCKREADRRRREFREQQKEERNEEIQKLRDAIVNDNNVVNEEVETDAKTANFKKFDNRCASFSKQFMFPDWLVAIPGDLSIQWLVQLRPEGPRGLLVIKNGTAVIRGKNGRIRRGPLKQGSQFRNELALTVLDVVVPETVKSGDVALRQCIYVLDVLFWDGIDMTCADSECRHFWLRSRFSEIVYKEADVEVFLPKLVYVPSVDAVAENIFCMYNR
jgi:hypothetical protein